MHTDSNWIDSLRGKRGTDLTLSQAEHVQKMIVDGDMHHIDGMLVTALADMAGEKAAAVNDADIIWDEECDEWFIIHGDYCRHEDDAVQAVIAAITGPTFYGRTAPGWSLTAAARAEDEIARGCHALHIRRDDAA